MSRTRPVPARAGRVRVCYWIFRYAGMLHCKWFIQVKCLADGLLLAYWPECASTLLWNARWSSMKVEMK